MRSKRAAAANAAAGRPHGPVAYGYTRTYDPKTARLVSQDPEPGEAAVMRELYDRLGRGHALRAVAADFEQRGVRTRTGKVFTDTHLRDMACRRCTPGYAPTAAAAAAGSAPSTESSWSTGSGRRWSTRPAGTRCVPG
jgi:hypothetical protein